MMGAAERRESWPLDRFPERETRIPVIVPRAIALVIAGTLFLIELYLNGLATFL